MTGFFVGLGLELEGRTVLEGELLDTVIGVPGSRTEVVVLRPPGGGPGLDRLAADCHHPVGGVGQFEGSWRMASVRGPEGILVDLAQRLG